MDAQTSESASGPRRERLYRLEDEIASAITHSVGLLFAIVGLCVLVTLAAVHGGVWHVIGCSVYGASLVTLYGASTIYHWVRSPRAKAMWRVVDHASIFLLIAGTYTPFTLTTLSAVWGWSLLVAVWTCAIAGITYKLVVARQQLSESAIPYILTGWLALVAVKPLVESVPLACVALLLGGGLAYTVGTIFYKFDHRRFFHAIWHGFVMAGSLMHFLAVMLYASSY
jgi:hemolysin III